MTTFNISRTFEWRGAFTEKVARVCKIFGLTEDWLREKKETHSCRVDIRPGDVVCITGPSGSGKTVLLGEIEKKIPPDQRINLNCIETCDDKTVVDCIAGGVFETLRAISIAGLNDTMAVLNRPSNLSEGQKWRFRLAVAVSMRRKYVFADEFCANLSRLAAATIAYKVARHAKREGMTFVVAAGAKDFLADLSPDVIISKTKYEPATVTYKDNRRNSA